MPSVKIGAVTVGQAPRVDVTADILPLLSGVELLERGGLDGLTREDIAAFQPEEGRLCVGFPSHGRFFGDLCRKACAAQAAGGH